MPNGPAGVDANKVAAEFFQCKSRVRVQDLLVRRVWHLEGGTASRPPVSNWGAAGELVHALGHSLEVFLKR
jgi:hypothetical protein